jgi:phage recombination protein Bet
MKDNATTDDSSHEAFLSPKDKELLKSGMLKEFSEQDQDMFFHYCEKTQLDPFTRQIYATSRGTENDDGSRGGKQLVMVTGISGFLWVAERTGQYDGDDAPQWCGIDGQWLDVWTDVNVPPSACRVTTNRKDRNHPSVAVVNWKSVAQSKKKWVNGKPTNEWEYTAFWRKSGPGQLAKCALAASLRKLFPSPLANIYSDDEIPSDEIPQETLDVKAEGENEAAQFIERAKDSAKILAANGDVNRVKQTSPPPEAKPEDFEDGLQGIDPPVTPAKDWWKDHVVQVIHLAAFKGKKVSEIEFDPIKAAVDKWVPKVGLRDGIEMALKQNVPKWEAKIESGKQSDDYKLTAEAITLRFLDDIVKKATGSLL